MSAVKGEEITEGVAERH